MTIDEIARKLAEVCPDWDEETLRAAATRLDLIGMEDSVERDIAALPSSDRTTLVDTKAYLARKVIEQQDTIMELERKVAHLTGVVRTLSGALAVSAQRVDVPPLDESWRQERNGRWL